MTTKLSESLRGLWAAYDQVLRHGGAPNVNDVEAFTTAYNACIAQAEAQEAQAIGEQTPVAWMSSEARDLSIEALEKDRDRLDFLDKANAALNASYGTMYRWELIMNHNVNRLMLNHLAVDLNDARANGLPSCRDAIDTKMQALSALRAERPPTISPKGPQEA